MKDFFGNDRLATLVVLRDLGGDKPFAVRVSQDRLGLPEILWPEEGRTSEEVKADRDANARGLQCFNGNEESGRLLDLQALFADLEAAGYTLGFAGVIGRELGGWKVKYLAKAVYYSPEEVARLKSLGNAQAFAEAEEDAPRRELRAKMEHFLAGRVREDGSHQPYMGAHGHHNPDGSFSVYIPKLVEPRESAVRRVRFVSGKLFTELMPPPPPREALKAPVAQVAHRGNCGDDIPRRVRY